MIPKIETIIEGLLSGDYTKQQAIGWLHQHAEDAGRCLRDEFAAAALPEIIHAGYAHQYGDASPSDVARIAFDYADAMLAERECCRERK